MSLVLQGSTSGSITLQEPAVAGSTVLNLPAVSGTILTTTSPKVGNVLQVSNAYKTDTQTISSGVSTFVDITGLSITITPQASSSKFLIIWDVCVGGGGDATHGYIRLYRNGTAIGLADAAGSRTTASSLVVNTAIVGQSLMSSNSFLDSPATASAVTYKLAGSNGSAAIYINRSSRDTDLTFYDGRATSSITVLEIAG